MRTGGIMPRVGAVIRRPGEGEPLELGETRALILVAAEDTGGRYALTETVYAPGFRGPPPHVHRAMVDSFYILEGTLRLTAGGEAVDAGPGTLVAVPPGVVHTFSNETDAPARVLNLFAPGGFEAYLRELAALRGPPEPATMAELASRYDFEVVDG
jgi:quercetin dioxygenase-like cupin family protein